MRGNFLFFIILLCLVLSIHHFLTSYPPREWRDLALGRFYFFRGDKEKAEKEFQKALENARSKPEILLEIGRLFLVREKGEQGEKFIRQLANKFPSSTTYYLLGQCLYLQGKLEEAEEILQKALELDPSNPYALNDLGYIWVEENKNLGEAVKMLERAVRKVRTPEILDSLGWAYVKTGRVEEGLKLLKKAVAENPYNWELRYHLGVAYEKLGERAFAEVELKKAEILYNRQKHLSLPPPSGAGSSRRAGL